MAFRVKDAARAFKRAVELGASPVESRVGPMELNIPAIEGIGGSIVYLVDRYGENTIYDVDFVREKPAAVISQPGLTLIDHLTQHAGGKLSQANPPYLLLLAGQPGVRNCVEVIFRQAGDKARALVKKRVL